MTFIFQAFWMICGTCTSELQKSYYFLWLINNNYIIAIQKQMKLCQVVPADN